MIKINNFINLISYIGHIMRDIETREDLLFIMKEFYDKLLADDKINFFFNKVTHVAQHLDQHLDILCTFWEQALFLKGGYVNNMFQIHKDVHDKLPFLKEHYDIWLDYLYDSIDPYFEGKVAEQMKKMAVNMATVLKIKLV
ncbi:group III truncated hemoglobin [Flavobacterium oreochromis]|uniref:group III truncated hemoglobin n=1 Tax=Flavobacterium oreochromis TaxID=2906078 RepID=UPI002164AEB0|nr:group III truncated hemoglobin [Flavobacterium oreochromis]